MQNKFWLDSKTVRGVLVGLLPTIVIILRSAGVEASDAELNTIIDGIAGVVGIVGAISAILGRAQADKPLTFEK